MPASQLKIIVADNHPVYRTGLEAILLKINSAFEILQAENGFEILDILKSSVVDLILTDIHLPLIDGIETICKAKKFYPGIKVIAFLSMNEKPNILKIIKGEINGFLLKNSSSAIIETAIKKILCGNNYFSEEVQGDLKEKKTRKGKCQLDKYLREDLSEREKEILILICQQNSTRNISEKTGLSPKTIEIHRSHIMQKTHSSNMIGLALYAVEKGYVRVNNGDLQIIN